MRWALGIVALLIAAYSQYRSHRRPKDDSVLEPLEIGRCPKCKSIQIRPIVGYQSLWECAACHFEFDPLMRWRERQRLIDSWQETDDTLS